MRFLHTADIHLGARPDPDRPWSAGRALAIRNTFRRILDTAARLKVDLLLIAGDLFHYPPTTEECAEVNDLFGLIPDTRVVIIAGNHDFIRDTSPYLTFAWRGNVTVLSSGNMTSVWFPEINTEVHGLSYRQPEITEPLYDHLEVPKDGRIHILLGHGGDSHHIPIHTARLAEAGFHYVALGHRHQPGMAANDPIVYCGSPEPTDRNDIGRRGYILGTIEDGRSQYNWCPCASGEYHALTVTLDTEDDNASILHLLQENMSAEIGAMYRITLEGRRNPAVTIDTDAIRNAGPVVDVTDRTEPAYDLEALQKLHRQDIISRYIQSLSGSESGEEELHALGIGLRALLDSEG